MSQNNNNIPESNVPVPDEDPIETAERKKEESETSNKAEVIPTTELQKALDSAEPDEDTEKIKNMFGKNDENINPGKEGEEGSFYQEEENIDQDKIDIAKGLTINAAGTPPSELEDIEFDENDKRRKEVEKEKNRKNIDPSIVENENGDLMFDENLEKSENITSNNTDDNEVNIEDEYDEDEEKKKAELKKKMLQKKKEENNESKNYEEEKEEKKKKKRQSKVGTLKEGGEYTEEEDDNKNDEENKEKFSITLPDGTTIETKSKEEKEVLEEYIKNNLSEDAVRTTRIIKEASEKIASVIDDVKKEYTDSDEKIKIKLADNNDTLTTIFKEAEKKIDIEIKKESENKIQLHGGRNDTKENQFYSKMVSNISEAILNLDLNTISKSTKIKDFNPDDLSQYSLLEAGNLRNERKVKVPLLASGLTLVMRSYEFMEQQHLIAQIREDMSMVDNTSYSLLERNRAYYRVKIAEFLSLYDHTEYVITLEGKKIRPKFSELMSMIKYCDIENYFFAAYAASHTQINRYRLECENYITDKNGDYKGVCGHTFEYATDNESLQYSLNNLLTMDDLISVKKGFVEGDPVSQNIKDLIALANAEFRRKPTKFGHVVYQRMPSINDYIETMKNFNQICKFRDQNKNTTRYKFDIELANIDGNIYDQDNAFDVLYLKNLMHINRMDVLVVDKENKDAAGNYLANYIKMDVNSNPEKSDKIRQVIMDQIYRLSRDEVENIISHPKFKKMCTFQTISHYISGARCPKCGNLVKSARISMEQNFFSQILR